MANKSYIKLIFSFNREVMQFILLNKEIYYTDRVWKNWIRVVPKDQNLVKRITMSRNKIPKQLLTMFTLTQKEKEEYESAKDDAELAQIVIRDARNKGCKFEKMEEINSGSII